MREPSGTRGNSDAGCPPSRGRAGRISIGALAAALLPLLLRPASATEPDLAFGAFQTGFYLTAFGIAINRIEAKKDPKAMTLLGELYTGGLGVPQNDGKAAEWYKLAADRGDREAMFALAMFRVQGRAGPRDREAGAKWLATAAKLGHPLAAYDLALLYMEGVLFPQDFTRAAENSACRRGKSRRANRSLAFLTTNSAGGIASASGPTASCTGGPRSVTPSRAMWPFTNPAAQAAQRPNPDSISSRDC